MESTIELQSVVYVVIFLTTILVMGKFDYNRKNQSIWFCFFSKSYLPKTSIVATNNTAITVMLIGVICFPLNYLKAL